MKNYPQTLTRARLKEAFHHKLELSMDESEVLLESILKELTSLIVKSNYVKIISFGTFLIHNKKARVGRNPKTKVEVTISPRKSVSFRPSAALRQKVNPS